VVEIENGQVWEWQGTGLQARTQWLDSGHWLLLSTPARAVHGGSCMMAMSDRDGRLLYTMESLVERLKREGWRKLNVPVERVLADCAPYREAPQ